MMYTEAVAPPGLLLLSRGACEEGGAAITPLASHLVLVQISLQLGLD